MICFALPCLLLLSAQNSPIHFGLETSITGTLQPWGEEARKGAQLAVDEFNKAGGLKGRKVVLDIGNPNSIPSRATTDTEQLLAKNHDIVVIGDVASGITRQIALAAFLKGVPVITPGSTNPTITKDRSNLFRVCYTDQFQGSVMAKFAFDNLHVRKVAIVTDRAQPYSVGLRGSFAEEFEKLGGQIVTEQSYTSGDTKFDGQIGAIKTAAPAALFLSGYFNEVGPFVRQAGAAGIKVPMLGGDGWDSSDLLMMAGDAIYGTYFCNHFNNLDPRPIVGDFLKKYIVRYSDLPNTTMAALGYDAAKLACQALTRAKTIDAHGMQDAIENTVNFDGVTGSISLKGRHGDPPKRAVVVQITKDGQIYSTAFEQDPGTGLPK